MSASTAETTSPRRLRIVPRTRRGKVTGLVALLVLVPLTAWAVYYFLLGISGTVASVNVDYRWDTNGVASSVPPYATATATVNSDTDLGIVVTGFYPGDSAQLNPKVAGNPGTVDGNVIGVQNPAGMPDGWTIELAPGACGAAVNESGSTNAPLIVSLDASAPAGSGGTLPADLALEVVPADQFSPALCP